MAENNSAVEKENDGLRLVDDLNPEERRVLESRLMNAPDVVNALYYENPDAFLKTVKAICKQSGVKCTISTINTSSTQRKPKITTAEQMKNYLKSEEFHQILLGVVKQAIEGSEIDFSVVIDQIEASEKRILEDSQSKHNAVMGMLSDDRIFALFEEASKKHDETLLKKLGFSSFNELQNVFGMINDISSKTITEEKLKEILRTQIKTLPQGMTKEEFAQVLKEFFNNNDIKVDLNDEQISKFVATFVAENLGVSSDQLVEIIKTLAPTKTDINGLTGEQSLELAKIISDRQGSSLSGEDVIELAKVLKDSAQRESGDIHITNEVKIPEELTGMMNRLTTYMESHSDDFSKGAQMAIDIRSQSDNAWQAVIDKLLLQNEQYTNNLIASKNQEVELLKGQLQETQKIVTAQAAQLEESQKAIAEARNGASSAQKAHVESLERQLVEQRKVLSDQTEKYEKLLQSVMEDKQKERESNERTAKIYADALQGIVSSLNASLSPTTGVSANPTSTPSASASNSGITINIGGPVGASGQVQQGSGTTVSISNGNSNGFSNSISNGTSPSGTAPTGTTPSNTTPSNTTPSNTTPSNTTPSNTTPSNTTPSNTTPSNTTPSNTTPSNTTPSGTPAPNPKKKPLKAKYLQQSMKQTQILAEPKKPWYKRLLGWVAAHPIKTVFIGLGLGVGVGLIGAGIGLAASGGIASLTASGIGATASNIWAYFSPTIIGGAITGTAVGAVAGATAGIPLRLLAKKSRLYTKFNEQYKKCQTLQRDETKYQTKEQYHQQQRAAANAEIAKAKGLFRQPKKTVAKAKRWLHKTAQKKYNKAVFRTRTKFNERAQDALDTKVQLNMEEANSNKSLAIAGYLEKKKKLENKFNKAYQDAVSNGASQDELDALKDEFDMDLSELDSNVASMKGGEPGLAQLDNRHRTFDYETAALISHLKDPKNNPIMQDIMARHSKPETKIVEGPYKEKSDYEKEYKKLIAEANALDAKGDKTGAKKLRSDAQKVLDAYSAQEQAHNAAIQYMQQHGIQDDPGPYEDNSNTPNP